VDVGDVAPPLKIKEWVRGNPVDLPKEAGKKLHLIEFWATWCPPCKASVPLLTDIQKKFEKDLVIIGVTDPDPYQNSPTEIKQFVKKQGASMTYTVAMDDGGATTQAYMPTDEPVGIPHAFLVGKDGKVVWQGSPLDPSMESVIADVIAGKYDVASARKAADRQRELDKRFAELEQAFEKGQLDVVWSGLMNILKMDPSNEMAMQLLTGIYIEEEGYDGKFREWASRHIQEHGRDPKVMAGLGATLLYIGDLSARVPDLALDAAKAAYETGKDQPEPIAIYAQAMYQIGALERAIELQKEALAKASDEASRKGAESILTYYENCKKLQAAVQ
jgi:thiol-disulfide isomerase/thioredoxin